MILAGMFFFRNASPNPDDVMQFKGAGGACLSFTSTLEQKYNNLNFDESNVLKP